MQSINSGRAGDELIKVPALFNGKVSAPSHEFKMASKFSGALQLTDLDDFISPSQVEAELIYD